jgi:hypothetical protein
MGAVSALAVRIASVTCNHLFVYSQSLWKHMVNRACGLCSLVPFSDMEVELLQHLTGLHTICGICMRQMVKAFSRTHCGHIV